MILHLSAPGFPLFSHFLLFLGILPLFISPTSLHIFLYFLPPFLPIDPSLYLNPVLAFPSRWSKLCLPFHSQGREDCLHICLPFAFMQMGSGHTVCLPQLGWHRTQHRLGLRLKRAGARLPWWPWTRHGWPAPMDFCRPTPLVRGPAIKNHCQSG